ncbi:MAG: hypothetical protein OEZ34_11330, partial [Spirochaetia bacterium]|nr:hypothetical protein [Spirochaetia bacterium]
YPSGSGVFARPVSYVKLFVEMVSHAEEERSLFLSFCSDKIKLISGFSRTSLNRTDQLKYIKGKSVLLKNYYYRIFPLADSLNLNDSCCDRFAACNKEGFPDRPASMFRGLGTRKDKAALLPVFAMRMIGYRIVPDLTHISGNLELLTTRSS